MSCPGWPIGVATAAPVIELQCPAVTTTVGVDQGAGAREEAVDGDVGDVATLAGGHVMATDDGVGVGREHGAQGQGDQDSAKSGHATLNEAPGENLRSIASARSDGMGAQYRLRNARRPFCDARR